MRNQCLAALAATLLLSRLAATLAAGCGSTKDAYGVVTTVSCTNNLCCSQYGYCGDTSAHCLKSNGCQAGRCQQCQG